MELKDTLRAISNDARSWLRAWAWNVRAVTPWSPRERSRSPISPAALSVNVTTSAWSAGTTPVAIAYAVRRLMTRVLPLPAPARIATGPDVASTASRCSGSRSWRRVSRSGRVTRPRLAGATQPAIWR